MLRGIPAILTPDLVKILMEMGHGDEIIFADRNFPATSKCSRVVRYDGMEICALLEAIMPIFPLDEAVEDQAILMEVPPAVELNPPIWGQYMQILSTNLEFNGSMKKISKADFYKRSESVFAVVATGDTARFGNLLLRKGIVKSGEEAPRLKS